MLIAQDIPVKVDMFHAAVTAAVDKSFCDVTNAGTLHLRARAVLNDRQELPSTSGKSRLWLQQALGSLLFLLVLLLLLLPLWRLLETAAWDYALL